MPDLVMESVNEFSDYWAGLLGARGGRTIIVPRQTKGTNIMSFQKEILDRLGKPKHELIPFSLANVPCEMAMAIAYYFPKNRNVPDDISDNIRKVKGGDQYLARAFGLYAAKMMDTSVKYDCVMRALSHNETNITGPRNALDCFAEMIAQTHSALYRRDLLHKKTTHLELSSLPRKERIDALTDNYYCTEMPYGNILVVDDITTTGTTAKSISDTIFKANKHTKVSYLMIGKTWDQTGESIVTYDDENDSIKCRVEMVPFQIQFEHEIFQSCIKLHGDIEKWIEENPFDK